jgi:uncharacterized protein with PIN domain
MPIDETLSPAEQLMERLATIRNDPDFEMGRCPNCDEETLEFNQDFEACEDCGYSSER